MNIIVNINDIEGRIFTCPVHAFGRGVIKRIQACHRLLRAMVFLPFLLFLSFQVIIMFAMERSAIYRNPTGDFSVGKFKRNSFHYLLVEKLASSMVTDQLDCTFLCVGEPKCYSFNMAAYPDSKGLYLCELLATDKYRATEKFQGNDTFHHYSPRVRK